MSDEWVIRQCSPTLTGLKTGSLFTAPCPSEAEMREDICNLNRILVPRRLRILPMRYAKKQFLASSTGFHNAKKLRKRCRIKILVKT